MIYLLEDDESIRDFVIYTLNAQGMEAQGFALPSAFWAAAAERQPDLVLLDIMLPEEDGISVLKKLRASARTRRMPVIMLTAKGTEYDKVLGLDAGADDYVAKPFGMMELLSRIRALLRRTETDSGVYRCGILTVDPGRHVVKVEDREVTLTQKEFEVLCLLLKNRDRSSPGSGSSPMCGIMPLPGRAAPWMSMSGLCARSWARREATSRPSGATGIRSLWRAEEVP